MDFRSLRLFVALAEELNYTRVAARQHITQPGLTRSIQRLEADLQVSLLVRTRTAVKLTPAGQVFLGAARDMLARLERGEREAREAAGSAVVRVRLALTFMELANLAPLSGLLDEFRVLEPFVHIELREVLGHPLMEAVERGEVDAGVVLDPQPHGSLNVHVLDELSFSVALAQRHPLADLAALPLAQLADEPMFMPPRSLVPRWHTRVETHFALQGLSACIRDDAGTHMQSALHQVAAGGGYMLLLPLYEAVAASLGVVVRPLEQPIRWPLALVWSPLSTAAVLGALTALVLSRFPLRAAVGSDSSE